MNKAYYCIFCSTELTKKDLTRSPNCCWPCLDDYHKEQLEKYNKTPSSAPKIKGKKK